MKSQAARILKTSTNDMDTKIKSVHKEYFESFMALEMQLQELNAIKDDERREQESELVIDAQAGILQKCASKRARLVQDTLYKLAIWRLWRQTASESQSEELSLSESVILSAFMDLAEFFNDPSVSEIIEMEKLR